MPIAPGVVTTLVRRRKRRELFLFPVGVLGLNGCECVTTGLIPDQVGRERLRLLLAVDAREDVTRELASLGAHASPRVRLLLLFGCMLDVDALPGPCLGLFKPEHGRAR